MTQVARINDQGSTKPTITMFSLTNPPSGSRSLVVTAGSGVIIGVNTFSNVDQTTPLATAITAALAVSATANNTTTNQLLYGAICADGNVSNGAGQTLRWNTNNGTIFGV